MKNSKIFLLIIVFTVLSVAPFMITKVFSKNNKENENFNVAIEEKIEVNDEENNTHVNNEKIEETKIVINEKGNIVSSEKVVIDNRVNDKTNNKVENKVSDNLNNKIENFGEIKVNEEVVEKENVKLDTNSNTKTNDEKDKSYFDNALFICDSRTVGIMEYGNLQNATFFCNTGMSVYNIHDKKVSVNKVGKMTLEELLTHKKFDKIYLMLGINELGYDFNKTVSKYKELVKYIDSKQDNPIIYIEANLHVTKAKSNQDRIINNKNIDRFNKAIKSIADNKRIFYIDINEKFDDNSGNLNSTYTQDKVHIYAKYYKEWGEWLLKNTF